MLTQSALTTLLALITFVAVNSVTPGPNNILLMVSGVNFGIRRTLPQMAGITTGLLISVIATGLGLGLVFSEFPLVRTVLMVVAVAYTLWLAWKVASAGSLGGGTLAHPMTYWAALTFQAVNPKLWMMVIATTAIYVHPGSVQADTARLAVVFTLVNIPAMLIWAGGGVGLRQALQNPRRIRVFNIAMGLLLAASVVGFLKV